MKAGTMHDPVAFTDFYHRRTFLLEHNHVFGAFRHNDRDNA